MVVFFIGMITLLAGAAAKAAPIVAKAAARAAARYGPQTVATAKKLLEKNLRSGPSGRWLVRNGNYTRMTENGKAVNFIKEHLIK